MALLWATWPLSVLRMQPYAVANSNSIGTHSHADAEPDNAGADFAW